jgi:DNA-directed RNA polymerase specialized sigma24 family protein
VTSISGSGSAADPPSSWQSSVLGDLPTPELLDAVVASAYRGLPWDELARRLVVATLRDLKQSIETGTIYSRCRNAGFGIFPRAELQRRPMPEHIAAEAVEECLERFKAEVLPRGEWDPSRGVPLEAFFASCCLADIANSWRRQLRQLPPHAIELDALDEPGQAGILALVADAPADPSTVVELRDLVTQALAPLNPQDRKTFLLLEQGWSRAEVAWIVDIQPAALDTRISRTRKAARARRTL